MSDRYNNHQRLVDQARSTVDKLGKHIDEGILRTVVKLWENGVETQQSCEGHRHRGCPFPWVNIPSQHIPLLKQILAEYHARYDVGGTPLNLEESGTFGRLYVVLGSCGNLDDAQQEMRKFRRFLHSRVKNTLL